jgi:hypothetical protein
VMAPDSRNPAVHSEIGKANRQPRRVADPGVKSIMRNKYLAIVPLWLLVGVALIWRFGRPAHAFDTCEGYRLAITMNCASDAILAHCRDRSPFVQGSCIETMQDECDALKDEVRRNCRLGGAEKPDESGQVQDNLSRDLEKPQ